MKTITPPQKSIPTLILVALSFAFGVAVRLTWVYFFKDSDSSVFVGQFMINNSDGYHWARKARALLGDPSFFHALFSGEDALPALTFVIAKILPVSLETLMFYMSVFFGSLIVVPLILIGRSLSMRTVGFVAAVFASSMIAYFNRTMVGYYDTDMLNNVLALFVLFSLILAFQKGSPKYLLLSPGLFLAYQWWYPSSYSLELAFIGMIFVYTLIFDRKNAYRYQLIAVLLVTVTDAPLLLKLCIILAAFFVFRKQWPPLWSLIFFSLAVLFFGFFDGLAPVLEQVKNYIFKHTPDGSVSTGGKETALHFYSTITTIRETRLLPFMSFAEKASGHIIIFVVSLLGYGFACKKHPALLLGLPLLGLGFLSLWGGLRFVFYAVPICALGVSYALVAAGGYLQKEIKSKKTGKIVLCAFVTVGSLAVLYPNIVSILAHRVPTVFTKTEVEVLDKLKNLIDRKDYIVTWWDYGYTVRYYSDAKTLIDGGKHDGDVNFPVSYMLTSSPLRAAKLARFEVEYTVADSPVNNTLKMARDAGFDNVNDFLEALDTDIPLPPKTREIYFYLPFRLMRMFPTVTLFSNIDVMTGKTIRQPFSFQSSNYKDSETILEFGDGIVLNKATGMISNGSQEVKVKYFIKTANTVDGKFVKERSVIHEDGLISIVYMHSFNTYVIMDDQTMNSAFVQMYLFEIYDETLFEPVIMEPSGKVYKVKI